MFGLPAGEELRSALVNATLLALWPVLPGLIIAYARQWFAIRRIRPDFALRKSEAAELDRAVQLYDQTRRRLADIEAMSLQANCSWRDFFCPRDDMRRRHADEIEDLEAHAEHLRAIIIRLRRRPLRRLQSWIHLLSTRFALGRALVFYLTGFALVMASPILEQSAFGDELTTQVGGLLIWYPDDPRLFHANAVAAAFAAVAGALFYLLRRARLCRNYEVEFCSFRELALVDLDRSGEPPAAEPTEREQEYEPEREPEHLAPSIAADAGAECFAVLGLSETATADEIKEAYKALIKRNHPDRVGGMSAAFLELAETETKKLNAAYREALASALPREAAETAVES